jgi:predicted nucleotidyltransferase
MNQVRSYQTSRKERAEIVEKIKTVLRREPDVVFAFLHGSFFTEQSFRDVDVAIFVSARDPSAYLDYEMKLSQRIEDALSFPYPVEVKIINQAPLSFRFGVIKGQLLFTVDEDLLVDFMTRTAREYLDIAPLIHRYMREAMTS